jgi:hypothetical protein
MKTRLTRQQSAAFRDKVGPMLRFLSRCLRRLEALRFDQRSGLYRDVMNARDAVCALHVGLHYESIGHGVGCSPAENEEPGDMVRGGAEPGPYPTLSDG